MGLIKSKGHINQTIASLTGITNELVQNKEPIDIVLNIFLKFIYDTLSFTTKFDKKDMDMEDTLLHVKGKTVILVAHNGNQFDIPFLMTKMLSGVVSLLFLFIEKNTNF